MRILPSRLMRYLRPMVQAPKIVAQFYELPFVDPSVLIGKGGALVLAPHPDDESIGCGGLIAAGSERGVDIHVMVITDGSASHPKSREFPKPRLASLRENEVRAAMAELGVPDSRIAFLQLPDGKAPWRGRRFAAATAYIAEYVRARGITTIVTSWAHDPHPDHKAAYLLGCAAARRTEVRLLCYPVWGWTLPNHVWLPAKPVRGMRIDITRHRAAKHRAIACHRSQFSDLIQDDPTAFRLTQEHLAAFDKPFEVFIEAEQRRPIFVVWKEHAKGFCHRTGLQRSAYHRPRAGIGARPDRDVAGSGGY
jgi:LmbE family N-acetylglucosaminyl deacetylase